jgi:SAM-dependent methyltransferase
MNEARGLEYRMTWEGKPVLREIYRDYYQRLMQRAVPGRILEIGGGSGNLKSFAADVVSTDIAHAPWLDGVADAQALPFGGGTFSNIVMVDVLHHIEWPARFFREAARVLIPGGRILMIEPGISPVSGVFYRRFHPEPVDMSVDPLADGERTAGRDPFESNQAIPTLIAGRHRDRFEQRFPDLRLVEVGWLSLFAYPLSGGFRQWSALPAVLARPLLRLEDLLAPLLGRMLGFRLLLVIERR